MPIGCSSCVGHAAVTACDRRTVRSAQPAAAGRRPAARGAAPPEGKIATTLGAALATLASASRSSRLHCRLARAAAEACAAMGYAVVVTLQSKVPDNARRDRATQGAGASSRRSSRLRVWAAQLCARRRGLPTPATYVRRWPAYDQPPSHAWRPGDRGLAGRDPAADVQAADVQSVGAVALH